MGRGTHCAVIRDPRTERAVTAMLRSADTATEVLPRYKDACREFKRSYLLGALAQTNWNVTQAARLAGLHRSHFYATLRSVGIACGKPNHGNVSWQELRS